MSSRIGQSSEIVSNVGIQSEIESGGGGGGVIKPTIAAGVVLATAEGSDSILITNADPDNPAAVDLSFPSNSLQATTFDQGTAQSPSYVLEAGTTRSVTLERDYGANDYNGSNVTETVTALLPDGTSAQQTLTVEPFIEVTGSNSSGTFNGTSDYLSTPYNAAYDFESTDAFSVCFWFNAADASNWNNIVLNKLDLSPILRGWQVYGGSTRVMNFICWSTVSNYYGVKTSTLSATTWYHIACTKNAANAKGSLKIYVNGVLDSAEVTGSDATLTGTMQIAEPLLIGSYDDSAGSEWDGSLDDIGVWSRELTPVEVASIYTNKTRCHKVHRAELIAYYDFDYVSGSLTGGIKDRTPNDFKMWFEGGEYGVFDGSEYLETPNNALFDFNYDDPFSVSLWMKSSVSGFGWFITNQLGSGSYRGWGLYKKDTNKWQFYMIVDVPATKYLIVDTTSTNLNDGNWHHIVMTYPGSAAVATNTGASAVTLYQDGGVEAHSAITDSLTADSTVSGAALEMGAGRGGGTIYTGQLRDVGIWDKVLEPGHVAALGVPGTAVNTVESANLVAGYTFPIQAVGSGLDPEPDISGNGLDMVKG